MVSVETALNFVLNWAQYIYRSSRRRKPTAHITYDLGLNLVRRFIEHSAGNTVEEVQAFTAQWVPVPRWVKVEELRIEQSFSAAAAKHITAQLGPIGISEVGGEKWWQWRKDESLLRAEWIEMRQDYLARKKNLIQRHSYSALYPRRSLLLW